MVNEETKTDSEDVSSSVMPKGVEQIHGRGDEPRQPGCRVQ